MAVRSWSAQKAGLTRAVNTKDPEKIKAEVKRTVAEWNTGEAPYSHGWPDDWSRWQRALDDVLPWHQQIRIDDL